MKILILNLLIFLSTVTPVLAYDCPEAYFCTKKGATLMYERRTPSSGKLWWRQTMHIHDVTQRPDGALDIAFSTHFQSEQVKSPVEEPVPAWATVFTTGDVQIDVAATAATAVKQIFKSLKFRSEGGLSTLEAMITPGDSLQEIHAIVSWRAFRYTIDFTERRVLRHETISVPAGTFRCIVVRERKLERRPFYKNDRITLTWYALGYGLVRHDTFFPDGQLESSEQLISVSV
ncbi:MAG: hypothetical protein IJP44_02720 [Bacteroidales bacterium]|nr:hypothetical protein [Bacteroidales bacterium]